MVVKPWYKQFWPWLLISLPVFSVVKAVHTVYIMNKQNPDLVVDDYYAEGKAINMNLAKYREAASRNLAGGVLIAGNKVIVTMKANPLLADKLQLSFVHNTVASKDFKIFAERSGESMFVADLPGVLDGKWNLVVSDTKEEWKLRASFVLPLTQEIKLSY
jgi:hypothetical protein